jgi:hypothetical protein
MAGSFDDLVPAPPPRDERERAGGAFGDLIPAEGQPRRLSWPEWIGDLFTGSHRTEHPELEEFQTVYERGVPVGTDPKDDPGYGTVLSSGITPDPRAQLDILRRNIPGLEHRTDRHGNIMLRAPRLGITQWTYLNRPGMSSRDFSELGTQFVATLPFGAPVGLGRNIAARAVIGAGALGGASVAQDLMAGAMGSEQGIDPTRAGISAGIGAAAGPLTGWLAGRAARAPTPLSRTRADQMVEDAAAHERLDVRPFGPGFSESPVVRGTARQLAETPMVGGPVRQAYEESIADAAMAARRIADEIAPNAAMERTGLAMQHGLDRYRTAGVADLEPGILHGLGINPNAPAQAQSVMTQGAAQRAAQAAAIRQAANEVQQATTSRGVNVPSANAWTQVITTRTTAEDLSDQALTRLVRAPSSDTSFAARSEALYESAWRRIPALFRSNETANPNLVRAVNADNAFRGIVQAEQRAGISGGIATGRFADMAERVRTNTTLPSLRSMRTEIGRALSNFGLYETGLDRTQLRQIYGALSRDIEVSIQDIANRARILAHRTGNQADLQVAHQANRALYEMRRADRYYRLGIERMDQFAKLVGASNPQEAVGIVIRAALDGTKGNIRMLRTAMAALRPAERREITSLAIQELGRPVGSARGIVHELGFSPSSFMTRFENMAPAAREILFGGEHARAIHDLSRVVSRLAGVEAMANTSRSATNLLQIGALGGVGSAMASGLDGMLSAIAGATVLMSASLLFSRPAYTRWLIGYVQARANLAQSNNRFTPAVAAHIARLVAMSRSDPALVPVVRGIRADNGVSDGVENDPRERKR